MRGCVAVFVAIGAVALAATPADAKPARCFTTDDGHYPCEFKSTDRAGSFEISAPGYPIYRLEVEEPGLARVFINLGNRFIGAPGMYIRQRDDAACWANPETETRLCAW